MTIGDRIREKRMLRGITQTELAQDIGVSKQTLYKYELNIITNIPSDKIEAMAHFLLVTPAYLMGWEENLSQETGNADFVVEALKDRVFMAHIKKLFGLSSEHKRTIYDNILYLWHKEGR